MDERTQQQLVTIFNTLLDACRERSLEPTVELLGKHYHMHRAYALAGSDPFALEVDSPDIRRVQGEATTLVVACSTIALIARSLELERLLGRRREDG